MNKILATLSIGTLLVIAAPGVANAKGGGGKTVKGVCSAASTSKLKVKADDPSVIQTEFEVDQNVVGDLWKVTISDNGSVVAHAKKTTAGPSGSFTVRKRIPDLAGTDTITAAAKNTVTGETCSATVSL